MSFLGIATVLSAAGLTLLALGLWGRRMGDEPRCRKCEYNLTGLTSQRCPECGLEASPSTIVWGTRRRCKRPLIIGSVLLAIGLAGFYLRLDRVQWIRHYPFRLVCFLAKSNSYGGLDELDCRYRDNKLSPNQVSHLAEICLDRQLRIPAHSYQNKWVKLLDLLDTTAGFTVGQQERYYEQMVGDVSIRFRARIRQGEPLLVTVTQRGQPIWAYGWYETAKVSLDVDGRFIDEKSRRFRHLRRSPPGERLVSACFSLPEAPGTHRIVCSAEVTLTRSTRYGRPSVWQKGTKLTRQVEVIPPGFGNQVALVEDPGLWIKLNESLTAREIGPQNPNTTLVGGVTRRDRSERSMRVDLTSNAPLPVSVAFRVYARGRGKRIEVGYWYAWKGSRVGIGNIEVDLDRVLTYPWVTLLLRADVDVANRTIGLGEIYNGEFIVCVCVGRVPHRIIPAA